MKTLYLLTAINIGLVLTSCTTINTQQPIDQKSTSITSESTTSKTYKTTLKKKNPLTVSFYPDANQIKTHYKILGTEKVSKYNMVGIKRQEATIQDTMRKIAASMGGDAVINVTRDNKIVSGTVVSFEDDKQQDKKV